MISDADFRLQLDTWTTIVRDETLRLRREGCAIEHCLKIATQIADSRLAENARRRQVLEAPHMMPILRQPQ